MIANRGVPAVRIIHTCRDRKIRTMAVYSTPDRLSHHVLMADLAIHIGEAPLMLPTNVGRNGLKKPGDKVEFELLGKPYTVELVSIGAEHDGLIHVVMRVNNNTRVYTVETLRAKKIEIRMAKGPGDIGAPIHGNIWRIGNLERGPLRVGDIVHKGEEIANLEAMKMENAIIAPFDGQVLEICVKLNHTVQEDQLLFVLEKLKPQSDDSKNLNGEQG